MDEQQLRARIETVLSGDSDAFEDIVRAYEKNVYNLCLRMCNDAQDALDLSQESFLKAYRALATFKGESKFSVWLYRIVSNTCLDFLRRRARRSEESLVEEDENGERHEREIPDERYAPERVMERRLTREDVHRGLMALSEDQRKILLLREIEGLNYQEIGQVLALDPGTVKSRIFRARQKLCDFLRREGNFSASASSSDKRGGGRA